MVVGNGAAAAAAAVAGVDGFPEVGAGGGAVVVKIKKEKNINMEAAVLHAVTDLVSGGGIQRWPAEMYELFPNPVSWVGPEASLWCFCSY